MFKTRSSLYDFVIFGSAKDLNIFWKEEGRLSFKYPCINVRTQSLYVSSKLRTFSFENNGFKWPKGQITFLNNGVGKTTRHFRLTQLN